MTIGDSVPSSDPAEEWIEDLRWHRRQYRQSLFQWSGSDALNAATEFTSGQQDFTTAHDLSRLETHRRLAAFHSSTCQRAFGKAARHARGGLGLHSWHSVADCLDLPATECSASAHFATWSEPKECTNNQVERVNKLVDGLFFTNPLIRAWELKQLWDLYSAAEDILEDALVDLAIELRHDREDTALAYALKMQTSIGLAQRIEAQRSLRGTAGDPRRIPRQYASSPAWPDTVPAHANSL